VKLGKIFFLLELLVCFEIRSSIEPLNGNVYLKISRYKLILKLSRCYVVYLTYFQIDISNESDT